MTWFDYGVLLVLLLSLVLSLVRGLVREVVSLVGWASGFVLATALGGTVAKWLPESLGPALSGLIAFLLIFVGVLVLAGFAALGMSRMVRAAGWTWTDRALGAAFGVTRGVIVVLVIVLLAGLTPLPREPFWRDAVLSGPFETAVVGLRPYLSDGLAQRIRYR